MRYEQFLTKYDLFSHQRTAIDHTWWHLQNKGTAYLRASMGAGKTKIIIDIANNFKGIHHVLVLCPAKAIQVWDYEIEKHSINDLYSEALKVNVYTLDQRTKQSKLNKLKEYIDNPEAPNSVNYVITNYESMNKLGLHHLKWDLIVADEVHYLKTHDSIRTKYAARLADSGKLRVGMTGTPIGGKYEHLFGQFLFVNKQAYGTNFYSFKYKYCIMGGYNAKEIVGYHNISHLNYIYQSNAVDIEVDHNIPSRHIDINLKLEDTESKEWYKKYATDLREAIAKNDEMKVLACVTRMQQITSGYTVVSRNTVFLNKYKIDALKELLENISENTVVFYRFKEDMRRIEEMSHTLEVPYKLFEISGAYNQYKEMKNYKGTKNKLIVVQIQSGSASIDLTDARYCIYYSNTHRFLDYKQSLARLDRPGQDTQRGVIYYHLITKKTVDESIRKSNNGKNDIMEALIRGG